MTLYPSDVLCTYDLEATARGVAWASHVPPELRDAGRLNAEWLDYEVAPYAPVEDAKFTYSIVGLPDLDEQAAYLGHFCNDGAKPKDASGAALAVYAEASALAANARFDSLEGLHCGVVATRDIAEGEEIFVSYGAAYWRSRVFDDLSKAAR